MWECVLERLWNRITGFFRMFVWDFALPSLLFLALSIIVCAVFGGLEAAATCLAIVLGAAFALLIFGLLALLFIVIVELPLLLINCAIEAAADNLAIDANVTEAAQGLTAADCAGATSALNQARAEFERAQADREAAQTLLGRARRRFRYAQTMVAVTLTALVAGLLRPDQLVALAAAAAAAALALVSSALGLKRAEEAFARADARFVEALAHYASAVALVGANCPSDPGSASPPSVRYRGGALADY